MCWLEIGSTLIIADERLIVSRCYRLCMSWANLSLCCYIHTSLAKPVHVPILCHTYACWHLATHWHAHSDETVAYIAAWVRGLTGQYFLSPSCAWDGGCPSQHIIMRRYHHVHYRCCYAVVYSNIKGLSIAIMLYNGDLCLQYTLLIFIMGHLSFCHKVVDALTNAQVQEIM